MVLLEREKNFVMFDSDEVKYDFFDFDESDYNKEKELKCIERNLFFKLLFLCCGDRLCLKYKYWRIKFMYDVIFLFENELFF